MKYRITSATSIIILIAAILVACSAGDDISAGSGPSEAAPAKAAPTKAAPTVDVSSQADDGSIQPDDGSVLPDDGRGSASGGNSEICRDINSGASKSYDEALAIAQSSQCVQEGRLKKVHFCNENTGTWWIDLEAEKPGCNPACVVDVNTGAAEINWRCTGALPPAESEEPQITTETPTANQAPDLFDYSGWQSYANEKHGYEVEFPPGVRPVWDDEGSAVTFEGPLIGEEHWPMFFVGHPSTDFYSPPAGVSVGEWLASNGQPGDRFSEESQIAGLPAFHIVNDRSPQSYASDEYYFIKDGQLFSIIILHTGDQQDWPLYSQFLESFSFNQPEEPAAAGALLSGWQGVMGAFAPGFQSRYYFDRDDGERWIVATNDEALWPAIANAAWTGKAVELSGLESPTPGQINVTGLGLVDQPPVEARNLSSFARPSASSVLPSDRLGTYHAWSAVDGQLASPWCEGADGRGAGEWPQLDFPEPLEVTMIQLAAGYDSLEVWGRPTTP